MVRYGANAVRFRHVSEQTRPYLRPHAIEPKEWRYLSIGPRAVQRQRFGGHSEAAHGLAFLQVAEQQIASGASLCVTGPSLTGSDAYGRLHVMWEGDRQADDERDALTWGRRASRPGTIRNK